MTEFLRRLRTTRRSGVAVVVHEENAQVVASSLQCPPPGVVVGRSPATQRQPAVSMPATKLR
jgi:hypothetical protein